MERRFAWMAFPGLLRFYAMLHALVFLLQIMRPDIGGLLEFDRGAILSGEVWRMVTFLFASSGFGGIGGFGMIFFFFMVLIAFMMSNALEGAWGVFRTTLFFYVGILGLLTANFIVPQVIPGSGFYLYYAAFFAFATLFPRVEFLLFFILPVQVRWLALAAGDRFDARCSRSVFCRQLANSRLLRTRFYQLFPVGGTTCFKRACHGGQVGSTATQV